MRNVTAYYLYLEKKLKQNITSEIQWNLKIILKLQVR